jgi:hypothetical protein
MINLGSLTNSLLDGRDAYIIDDGNMFTEPRFDCNVFVILCCSFAQEWLRSCGLTDVPLS